MPIVAIPISDGQSFSADELSGGHPEVYNLLTDDGGMVMLRPGRAILLQGAAPAGTLVAPVASPHIGAYAMANGGKLITVTADRAVYVTSAVSDYQATPLSTATATTKLDGSARPTFAEDGTRVIIAGGGQLQQWVPGEAATKRLATPTTTDDPPYATHVVTIGSRLVANDSRNPDEIKWSDLFDGGHTNWQTLSFEAVDARPDRTVALGENTRELFAFGQTSLQVFGVSPDPMLPFAAVNTVNVGMAAPWSLFRSGDAFAWLDERLRFVRSNGRTIEVLDDRDGKSIAPCVRSFSRVDDAWGFQLDIDRWGLLCWVFPSAGRFFGFEYRKKQWMEWRRWDNSGVWALPDIGAYVYWPLGLSHVVGSNTTNDTYKLDPDSQTDIDGGILAGLHTGPFNNFGLDVRKRCVRELFYLRRNRQSTAVVEVQHRDDMGAWTPWRQIATGGGYDPIVQHRPGGIFRVRQHRFRYTDPAALSLARAEMDFAPCSS